MLKNQNTFYLTIITVFVGLALPICKGEQPFVATYQCTSEYVELLDPPAISKQRGMVRVCITGISSAVECKKIVEVIIRQPNKSIEERLVAGGLQQVELTESVEVTSKDGKCMIAAPLSGKYFIETPSSELLQVVVSGSVAMTTTSSNTTAAVSSGGRHLRGKPAEGTEVTFEIPINLIREIPSSPLREDDESNPNPTEQIASPSPEEVDESIRTYQCTSDFVEVINPPAIDPEIRMLRVCIAGISSGTTCQQIAEAAIAQTAKSIEEKVVVGGETRDALKDRVEIEAQGGKCMIAAHLTDKYFIKSSGTESLKVVVSGSVLMATTSADSTTSSPSVRRHLRDSLDATTVPSVRRHLRAEPAQGTTEIEFKIPISLKLGGDNDVTDPIETAPTPVDGAAGGYGIAMGVVALMMMMS